jgi:hypothetical protein
MAKGYTFGDGMFDCDSLCNLFHFLSFSFDNMCYTVSIADKIFEMPSATRLSDQLSVRRKIEEL